MLITVYLSIAGNYLSLCHVSQPCTSYLPQLINLLLTGNDVATGNPRLSSLVGAPSFVASFSLESDHHLPDL